MKHKPLERAVALGKHPEQQQIFNSWVELFDTTRPTPLSVSETCVVVVSNLVTGVLVRVFVALTGCELVSAGWAAAWDNTVRE